MYRSPSCSGQLHLPRAIGPDLAGVTAISLWCLSGVCYRAGAVGIGAMVYLSLTSAIGVAAVASLHLLRRRPIRQLLAPPLRVIVAGLFGIAGYSILLVWAIGLARPAHVGAVLLLNYLWPVWIILLSVLLLRQRVRPVRLLAAAALSLSAIVLACCPSARSFGAEDIGPYLMALGASVLWALYSVLLRRWDIALEQGGSTIQFLICAVVAGAIAAGTGRSLAVTSLSWSQIGWVMLGGIGPVGLAYYLWEIAMKAGCVHRIALLANFIPVGSAGLLALYERQALTPTLLPAAVMIAAGAWIGGQSALPDTPEPGLPSVPDHGPA